ncbi:XRE family transcriptional regulator [Cupriavidus necator]|uniref:XRE family transcriptional regulator n=1 Tax=Cupriavidus necator TaxID=106590 RepID=UPI00339D73AA
MFRFEYGTTNVYALLGFADAEDIPLKAEIVKDMTACMRASGISLSEAAAMLGTLQSDLALVLCGKFQDIGADELRGWLARLTSRLWLRNIPPSEGICTFNDGNGKSSR